MFKIGDKVINISNSKTTIFNLTLNEIYVVSYIENYVDNYGNRKCNIGLEGISLKSFMSDRFISLKEYRKQKINKLCSKSEIK